MKRPLLATWIALAVVLLGGTTAFAASRLAVPRPRPSDLPLVITTKPMVSATVTVPATPAGASGPAGATSPAPSKPKPASPASPPKAAQTDDSDDDHETVTSPDDDSGDSGDESDDEHETVTSPDDVSD